MISVILTVFNKQWLIDRVVEGIFNNKSDNIKELIFVFDGCTDSSERIARRSIPTAHNLDIKILYADNVFETIANNIGLKASTQPYCMIIQDDMVMTEKDFDSTLLLPFKKYGDLFAVSARTAHDNTILNNVIDHVNIAGKESNLPRGILAIRDSCNRGPLLIRHDYLEKLNYLDESFAPQGLDDHDLCMRAYRDYGLLSGSYMIDYRSDVEWGTSRTDGSKHIINRAWYKNSAIMVERHREALLGSKHGEERICP